MQQEPELMSGSIVKSMAPVISPPSNKRSITMNLPSLNLLTYDKPKRKKQKLGAPKNLWSPTEDQILETEVMKLGEKAWSEIAAKLPGRVGKQCRDRWRNHLCPEVKKGSWTDEEDRLLFEYREKLGNQWAEIAKHIPGRTDLSVKNRFYSYRRKLQRQKKRQEKVKSAVSVQTNATKNQFISAARTLDLHGLRMTKGDCQSENDQLKTNCTFPSPTANVGTGKDVLAQLTQSLGPAGVQLLLNNSLVNSMNFQLALYQYKMKNGLGGLAGGETDIPSLSHLNSMLAGMEGSGLQSPKVNPLNFATNLNAQQSALNLASRANFPSLHVDTNLGVSPQIFMQPDPQQKPVNIHPKPLYNRTPICSTPLAQIKPNFP